jgi:hypothetical protein
MLCLALYGVVMGVWRPVFTMDEMLYAAPDVAYGASGDNPLQISGVLVDSLLLLKAAADGASAAA